VKRLALTMFAVAVFVTVFASYAGAFTMSQRVVVSGQLIAIARVPAGGYSADERINQVNERLAYILGYEPLAPRYIHVRAMCDGSRAIMVGDRLLITVTAADARANNTTIARLTEVWLARAREAIPQARPNANLVG
jgi:hypothetical protein